MFRPLFLVGAALAVATVHPNAAAQPSLRPAAPAAHAPSSTRTMPVFRGHATAPAAAVPRPLVYRGGLAGAAVQRNPKVYLVFYGKQWGTASTVGANLVFSADPAKVAPRLQNFLRGLYGNENWSTSTTQFCDGSTMTAGRTTCSSGSRRIKHPTTSPLAGVWYDNAANAVAAPRETSIRASAVRAAKHFGRLTAAANAGVQYVVVAPHGVVPSGFGTQYCAYHNAVTTSVGMVAYTNLPYIPDAGIGCGQNLVNTGSAGKLDGVTIVAGHEYAEVLTDMLPPYGWIDALGEENADKCTWITSGPAKARMVTFPTGRFPVQSLFSNNANSGKGGCVTWYDGPSAQG